MYLIINCEIKTNMPAFFSRINFLLPALSGINPKKLDIRQPQIYQKVVEFFVLEVEFLQSLDEVALRAKYPS